MPKFRKIGLTEMYQFNPEAPVDEWPRGVEVSEDFESYSVATIEGIMRVKPTDWIAYDVDGNPYVIDVDIQARVYELVEE